MQSNFDPRIEKILISTEQINEAVKKAAGWINRTYKNEKIIIITILKGSIPFVGAILPLIEVDVEIDFICVSSFKGGLKPIDNPEIKKTFSSNLNGKNVILVEDIVDSGNTISKVMQLIKQCQPKSCRLLTFLDKPSGRKTILVPDYACFVIENLFVVGFGLDYKEFLRNLPYVGILKKEVYENDGEI